MSEVAEDPEPYATSIDSELFLEVEGRVHDDLSPYHTQLLQPILRNSIAKSINMASPYAAAFAFGVGEPFQNWLDSSTQLAKSLQADPTVLVNQHATAKFADLVANFGLKDDFRVFVASTSSSDLILGILLTCNNAAGRKIFCSKNYGARMKPDDLILGNSSKQDDESAADLNLRATPAHVVSCI